MRTVTSVLSAEQVKVNIFILLFFYFNLLLLLCCWCGTTTAASCRCCSYWVCGSICLRIFKEFLDFLYLLEGERCIMNESSHILEGVAKGMGQTCLRWNTDLA